MTAQTLQLVTFSLGLSTYLVLILFCTVAWIRGITGRALFSAATLTFLYLAALSLTGESPVSQALEYATLYAWIALTLRAIGLGLANFRHPELRAVLTIAASTTLLTVLGIAYSLSFLLVPANLDGPPQMLFVLEVLLSVAGLVTVEQLVRNTREDLRWRLRYLNIGLGLIFTFGMLKGAVATLFGADLLLLTLIQPAVLSFAVPFLVIASLRNRETQLKFSLSRQFVFRSGVLITTGTLLLLMGLAGYYVQLFGGDVGTAAVILVITLLVLGMFVIGGSRDVQQRVRHLASRHLFSSKHDHREQWARVTRQLTEPHPDYSLEQQAIRALLGVIQARGGAFWRLNDRTFTCDASFLADNWIGPLTPATSAALIDYFSQHERVIDLGYPPERDQQVLFACEELRRLEDLRFLLPLIAHQQLIGFVGISAPVDPDQLTTDDRDIIQLVSREVAGFLALRAADTALSQSEQFDAMNRLTTFLIHDVKTITAQLSLVVENAEKHKGNPAFIDDMLDTVRNAAERMQRLLRQIGTERQQSTELICVGELLPDVMARFSDARPRPRLVSCDSSARIVADRERLANIIGHTLQNAIDATDEAGNVEVQTLESPPWLELSVSDNGTGMDPDFIASELFAPFRSTKGVAGMGIGSFQAREYVRSIGGDVLVRSTVGKGSTITLKLPIAADHE